MKQAPKVLSKRELAAFVKKHPEWQLNKRHTEIKREFVMPDYITGLVFMARVAVHAEIANHHPDMTLSYGRVKVTLSTHDSKGLTKLDTTLAGKIDKLQA